MISKIKVTVFVQYMCIPLGGVAANTVKLYGLHKVPTSKIVLWIMCMVEIKATPMLCGVIYHL